MPRLLAAGSAAATFDSLRSPSLAVPCLFGLYGAGFHDRRHARSKVQERPEEVVEDA